VIIVVTRHGIALEQPHDFRAFSIAVADDLTADTLRRALGDFAALQGESHAWVSEAALRRLAPVRDDRDWQKGLDGMIAYARKHGWVDAAAGTIRAHVVRRA